MTEKGSKTEEEGQGIKANNKGVNFGKLREGKIIS